jgi:hypothetical protein
MVFRVSFLDHANLFRFCSTGISIYMEANGRRPLGGQLLYSLKKNVDALMMRFNLTLHLLSFAAVNDGIIGEINEGGNWDGAAAGGRQRGTDRDGLSVP